MPHRRSLTVGTRPRLVLCRLVTVVALVGLAAGCASTAPRPTPSGGAPAGETVTLLAINDVYRVEGVDAGENGGLARLRTLRAELEEEAPGLLTLHAGDFLFPSLLSSAYGGAQMVDVLNLLDGDAGAFDGRLYVVFGNHEFDRAAMADAAMLDQRIEESGFTWLGTNVEFAAGDDGRPLVEADNLVPTAIVEAGGVRVGIFGITTGVKHPAYVTRFGDPVEVARETIRALRAGGAEVVVALTHQTVGEDRAMVEALGDDRPDVVVGGHEHEKTAETAAGVPILKADAEARTATVIELSLPPGGGEVEVDHRFVALDESVAEDPEVAGRVDEWIARHDREFCAAAGEPPGCLGEELALARTDLVAEELEIRRFETNFGSWIADRALATYRPEGADLAFLNAGSIRLNQDVPAGAWVTRRHVEELFPYPGELELLEIDGATLQQVLDHAVSDWTGVGWWLQVAGLAFRHDPSAGAATDLTLLTDAGPRPIRPDDRLRVVTGSYLVDPTGDQDGYRMLGPDQRVPGAPSYDLKQLVVDALREAGEEGIAPQVEGRICNPERPGRCLAVDGP